MSTQNNIKKIVPDDVLTFWFGPYDSKTKLLPEVPTKMPTWFQKSDDFDKEIKEKFGETLNEMINGE